MLHGELYNHDLKDEFEKLGSLLKKEKDITAAHRAEVAAKVQLPPLRLSGARSRSALRRAQPGSSDMQPGATWASGARRSSFVPTVRRAGMRRTMKPS
jgi:hypothetical protein